jgi:hypothetical protein
MGKRIIEKIEQSDRWKHHRIEKKRKRKKNLVIFWSIKNIGVKGGLWMIDRRKEIGEQECKTIFGVCRKRIYEQMTKILYHKFSINKHKFYMKIVNFLLLF